MVLDVKEVHRRADGRVLEQVAQIGGEGRIISYLPPMHLK